MSAIDEVVGILERRNRTFQTGHDIAPPIAEVPDRELVATLVGLGMPAHDARSQIANPQLRLAALRAWVDVGDAGRGDKAAKERVDYMRAAYDRMRREGIISDDPRRPQTDAFDPKELL